MSDHGDVFGSEGAGSGDLGEDRVMGLEPVDGFTFESDGSPIAELQLEDVDSLVDLGGSVAQLAAKERWWRFGHVIVDEAQDLTPMQWRMVARRARNHSMTIVGDLAQCSIGEPESWDDVLPDEVGRFDQRELTINYRSPAEINDLAAAILAELAPGLSPSRSIRASGHQPVVRRLDNGDALTEAVTTWRSSLPEGRMALISAAGDADQSAAGIPGVEHLDPWQAKGLEFDHVVVAEPAAFLGLERGLSLLYVALTRATERLLVLHQQPLPPVLEAALGSGQTR